MIISIFFKLCNFTSDEINKIVSGLNINKFPGHDSKYIDVMYCSVYPQILKISKMVPIPKQIAVYTVIENRPFGLLLLLVKILEKTIHR